MNSEYLEKKGICGICPAGCCVIITYDKEGRLDRVRPDDTSPLGMICKLGEHSKEIVYSKDRLLYPMKRKGPKGTYEFKRISWDEAYDIIVRRLNAIKRDYGPESVAIYTGRGSFEQGLCDIFQIKGVDVSTSATSVLFPFGSPNTFGVGALCYVSFAMIAPHVTMGGMWLNMFSDLENSQLIVIWGANPVTDCPPTNIDRILGAHRKRGAKVVVIDPRKTMTAKLTKAQWIPIRPGTDGALALGMCYVIIKEELYNETFVRDWTHGFDDFSEYVQHFRPEVVEKITGVPGSTIISLAREIADSDGASPVMYSGLEYCESGVQAIRATIILWALCGQLDVPGGRCFTMRDNLFTVNRSKDMENPDIARAIGRDRFPLYSEYRGESHAIAIPESVLEGRPYKIHSLIIHGASIITSWPESKIWRETLSRLNFLVTIDRQLTADSAYADIVLPATTMYEIESYMLYGPIFKIRERIIEPVGESRNDYFILVELANRLGYGGLFPRNEEELFSHVLKGTGFTIADVRKAGGAIQAPTVMMEYKKWEKGLLRNDGKPGFNTPTGKFEISSTIFEEHGYDPLPVYTEPEEGPLSQPELGKAFPLVFNSGARVTTDFRSQHHGIPGLLKERPVPTVTINRKDAESRGIENGDMVRIRTKRDKVSMKAFVTDDIIQGAIDANMGGGGPVGPLEWQNCNINDLTDISRYDPISGFPVYKALLCEVERMNHHVNPSVIDSGEGEKELSPSFKKEILSTIYFDNNATTPIDREVQKVITGHMEDCYGNPSSIYRKGKEAKFAIESARRMIAGLLNCTARRIVFTGGGSEANNLAIKGFAFSMGGKKNHIITTAIEHPSVIAACKWLESRGFNITWLEADRTGEVDPNHLESAIRDETCLISIMTANNETGTIQPIDELAEIARMRGVTFHTDAVQAVGKIPVDVEASGIDLLSLSGHKFGAQKGIGVLYIRKGIELDPLIHGGKQEGGQRGGTENLSGIIGIGKAAELAIRRLPEMNRIQQLRDQLETGVKRVVSNSILNGHPHRRLPNTLNVTLPGFRGESIVLAMDQRGISISSGSACRSGAPEPSHALLAMGLTDQEAHCALRFSLGIMNTSEEVDMTLSALEEIIVDSKTIVQFIPCR